VSQSTELEALLEYLKRTRGFDFTGYKRASLERRVLKRMQAVGIASIADYVDFLEVHPEEFAGLFNTVLINVTSFFRDPSTWEFFAQNVVPDIAARRTPPAPIRIWSAGCASGEEAYTLAMLFAEQLSTSAASPPATRAMISCVAGSMTSMTSAPCGSVNCPSM
jgi:two-component system CheB/CheR fusion protein